MTAKLRYAFFIAALSLPAALSSTAHADSGKGGYTWPSTYDFFMPYGTKDGGPVYAKPDADRVAADKGWVFKQDGDKWRRVVPSPLPKRIFELRPIKWLLDHDTVVIAAGGGGIPTMYEPGADRHLIGVECVIDKDFATELLARELMADLLVILTDADAVYLDWGKPTKRAIRSASPEAIGALDFPAGSMGPKVEAACRFATLTGKKAAIGALADLEAILDGRAGTTVAKGVDGLVTVG